MLSITERSLTLNEIYGYTKTVSELKSRLSPANFGEVNIPQSVLLAGASGTGKTTLSFILAKTLNCQKPIMGKDHWQPCNDCASCKDIINETFRRDVIFIDCSSMSKDDMVKLEQLVNVQPMYDRNKIIILDEFQQLSKAGKGATLKLLEKPRKNVYFFACTMDEKSIDKAIVSRCITYRFHPIDTDTVLDYYKDYITKHNLIDDLPDEFFEGGIFALADSSNGSMRQAVINFERVLEGKIYSEQDIQAEFGFVADKQLFDYILALLNYDRDILFNISCDDNKEDLFYKMQKILIDAYIYKITQKTKEAWKEKNAKMLSKYDNLLDLVDILGQVKITPYFNQADFLTKLLLFVENKKSIIKTVSDINNNQNKVIQGNNNLPTRPKRVPVGGQ